MFAGERRTWYYAGMLRCVTVCALVAISLRGEAVEQVEGGYCGRKC